MRILSDILPLQTPSSRQRGIGRYTTKVLQALLNRNEQGDSHILVANGHLPQPDPFPADTATPWRLYYADYPLGEYQANGWQGEMAAYNAYWQAMVDRFAPDVLHIHSPFEWNAAPPHGRYRGVPTVVTVYDLIPLRLQEHYLSPNAPWLRSNYHCTCDLIRQADHIIAISELSRQDIIELLGVDPHRVSVAMAGPNEIFAQPADPVLMTQLRERFGLGDGFVICNSGYDYRKNLGGTMQAYSRLAAHLRAAYPLVIVCALQPAEEHELRQMARELDIGAQLVLTNYVSDDELVALYHMATVSFFPSLYEGFGLPVLDAMMCGLPVITSNVSSLPEVAGDAGILVDPQNAEEMAEALTQVLQSEARREEMRAQGFVQVAAFTWERTAQVFHQVYEHVSSGAMRRAFSPPFLQRQPPVIKTLGLVSPLPPQRTGVADFGADLLRALHQHLDVTAFVQADELSAIQQQLDLPVESVTALPRMVQTGQVDAVLYQIGNSPFHHFALPYLQCVPGVVEIHDGILHGMIHTLTLARGDGQGYRQELSYAHGQQGREHAEEVLNGRAAPALFDLAANRRVVNSAIGTIVHNQWAANAVQEHGTNQPIEVISLPVRSAERGVSLSSREACRSSLGLAQDVLIFATFGRLSFNKRLDVLLRAFARLHETVPVSRLLLVGPLDRPSVQLDVPQLVRDLGIAEWVQITGYVDDAHFAEYMAATDVGINLRYPHAGESSATLVRLLNAGIPIVTSNLGPFANLPDDCCWKVDVDEWEEELLLAYLCHLVTESALRRQMSENALRFARENIPTWDDVAQAYLDFMHAAIYSQAPLLPRIQHPDAVARGATPPGSRRAGWRTLARTIRQRLMPGSSS